MSAEDRLPYELRLIAQTHAVEHGMLNRVGKLSGSAGIRQHDPALDYLPTTMREALRFRPHDWVVGAMREAYELGLKGRGPAAPLTQPPDVRRKCRGVYTDDFLLEMAQWRVDNRATYTETMTQFGVSGKLVAKAVQVWNRAHWNSHTGGRHE